MNNMALVDRLKPEVAEKFPLDWLFEMECLEVLLDNSYRNPIEVPLWAARTMYNYVYEGDFNYDGYINMFKDNNQYEINR